MNCYVLIGGRSTRIGRSKAELFFTGVVTAVRPVFESVVAVQRPGAPAAEIETIYDEGGDAPIFGVLAALSHARNRCFIMATDYPLITTALVADLRRRFEASSAAMLVPVWQGIPQTLCAGYAPSLIPVIEERIAEGKLDLRGLLSHAEMVAIEGEMLLNVNTPAELEEVERLR